jgi:MFS family permease
MTKPNVPRGAPLRNRWPWSALSRNVRVLSLVSFFQDTASEMLYPVLPLFITSVLGASPAILGLIEGVAEGTASIMKGISGRLADMRRRRPLVAAGYGISSVSKLLIGLATGWPLVLVGRFADRVGKGVRSSPRDALIADDTPSEHRGRAFGFHRAADTMGAVLGPLIGLGIYELLNHRIRPLFFVAFVPAAVSVGLIFLVREPPRSVRSREKQQHSAVPLGRPYIRVVAFLTVFALVNFSDAFLILRASKLGLGFAGVILVYALYNLSYALLALPAGIVSDRVPRRLVFGAGLCVFAASYLGLGLAASAGWVWLLLPLYGAYTALTDGVSRAWIADLVPAERVGSGLGLYGTFSGIGSLIAGIWAGLAWGGTGRLPLIISGAVVALLAVVLLAFGHRLDVRLLPERPADMQ